MIHLTSSARRWRVSAAVPVTQRHPIAGPSVSIAASALLVVAISVDRRRGGRSPSSGRSECEAPPGRRGPTASIVSAVDDGRRLAPRHRRDPTASTTTIVLAGSPSSPSAAILRDERRFGGVADAALRPSSTVASRGSWSLMRWHGGGPRDDDAYDAWQSRGRRRIGQAFSVITRGAEIAARLSPLAILVPVAVVASYVDLTARGITRDNEIGRRAIEEGAGGGGANDDEFAPPRFRESNSSRRGDRRLATTTTTTTTTWASDLAWRYALFTLQRLGPAFVKLGQWAATRRDLFPVHFCDRLSRLHDAARVHDWRHTHEALVDAFGEDYESRGLVVVRNDGGGGGGIGIGVGEYRGILGSGSAAQVHIGTLRERAVAVKVLHPNTRQLVERDLEMMRHLADFVEYIFPFEAVRMLSLPRAVSNFASVMERQVDLRIEGDNLRAFRENFGCISAGDDDDVDDAPPPTITFPRPEPGWVSERVLVEEHAGDDAVPISSYLFDDSPEGLRTRKELARPLLLAFLKMVFIDNFIHADLHPGNVLVRPVPRNFNNPRQDQYTIIFIDAGIATSLQPNDRKNLCDLFRAVVVNDGYSAGELMVERARYQRCTSIPDGKHKFAFGVSNIVSEFHDRRKQGLTLGAVRVGSLLGQVLDLCRKYRVEIDPAMSSVVVSMLVLEGLGRSLDPDLNLIKAAMPFLLTGGKV